MIRPRRRCDACGGKVEVLRVIRARKGRRKGTTDDRREAWRCVEKKCGAVQVTKATSEVDKR